MPTGSEVELYRNIGRIAHALDRVATVLENEQAQQLLLGLVDGHRPDPFARLSLDEQLDLRSALTEAIDLHGKLPEDQEMVERVGRWQSLAERLDYQSDPEEREREDERPGGLPDPPEHLAEAWRRFQAGEGLPDHEARALDEWRVDCARDAGF
jgi:hypothetical protein